MTCADTPNATSSPEAASGPSQPGSPDGPIIARSGPALARASRSRRQAKAEEQVIQGICGRTYIASSVPPGHLSSWESRLRERLATVGSTESALIWRSKTTPAGQLMSRCAPSTARINGTASTGSLWSTPRASDGEKGGPNMSFGAGGTPLPAQMYAYNPTPTVADVQGGRKARSGSRSNEPLLNGLLMSYSPTPQARDGFPPHKMEYILAKKAEGHDMANLNDHMLHHFETARGGPTLNGSSAPSTGKRGAPNPEFAFWLMGFSDEWISGALAAMRSHLSLRQKSSRRSSKPKR